MFMLIDADLILENNLYIRILLYKQHNLLIASVVLHPEFFETLMTGPNFINNIK